MGKDKIEKRVSIQKQFVTSFSMVIVLSLITSLALIVVFYGVYHHAVEQENVKTNDTDILEIMKYSQISGNDSVNLLKEKLDRLVSKGNMEYYIKDNYNKIIYSSEKSQSETVKKLLLDTMKGSRNSTTMNIPLLNKITGKVELTLVLIKYDEARFFLLSLVDLAIPFICFVVYTLLFAKRISRRIRTPITHLMNGVEKIKNRDLDFSIENSENSEIGDLISAFEEMRSQLKDSLIREWELEQERRDMVCAITHDMKTPLAIIQGHVEGLQDGLKNDADKLDSYLNIIEQNVHRSKKLIDEMNELVEVDSVDFALDLYRVDLKTFIDYTALELKVLADKKNISIEIETSDDRKHRAEVPIDGPRLGRVINNLIGNSLRFIAENGIIKIYTEIEENKTIIKICDTGPGFAEKDLKKLFKKFYKGDESRSMEKGHSGLGMYIAKKIVEKHGGEIKAYNLHKGGACVEFYITYQP